MAYIMEFRVSGRAKVNQHVGPIGVVAACLMNPAGDVRKTYDKHLDPHCNEATSQRVALSAIILALQKAQELHRKLKIRTRLAVSIATDSQAALDTATRLASLYSLNNWKTDIGQDVLHKDLMQVFLDNDAKVKALGTVRYRYIPVQHSTIAREASRQALDNFEIEISRLDPKVLARWEEIYQDEYGSLEQDHIQSPAL
ncbi:hypothetical protein K445DRAFT_25752 [Daldinia sp. EC12]|nr:hypothetical protein F4774DRAFT_421195 [Daldinia eschscholtzii]OTB12179.1 hypothetical protein K445DRAFT_25752 [Daldinia sp. EC12]